MLVSGQTKRRTSGNVCQASSSYKAWLTQGIKISCINKRKLYLISRHSHDQNKKIHYRRYCKVLAEVIKLAKRKYYNNLLTNSTNKTRTTWNIINENINKRHGRQGILSININGVITRNNQVIANTFNSYYSSVAVRSGTHTIGEQSVPKLAEITGIGFLDLLYTLKQNIHETSYATCNN